MMGKAWSCLGYRNSGVTKAQMTTVPLHVRSAWRESDPAVAGGGTPLSSASSFAGVRAPAHVSSSRQYGLFQGFAPMMAFHILIKFYPHSFSEHSPCWHSNCETLGKTTGRIPEEEQGDFKQRAPGLEQGEPLEGSSSFCRGRGLSGAGSKERRGPHTRDVLGRSQESRGVGGRGRGAGAGQPCREGACFSSITAGGGSEPLGSLNLALYSPATGRSLLRCCAQLPPYPSLPKPGVLTVRVDRQWSAPGTNCTTFQCGNMGFLGLGSDLCFQPYAAMIWLRGAGPAPTGMAVPKPSSPAEGAAPQGPSLWEQGRLWGRHTSQDPGHAAQEGPGS